MRSIGVRLGIIGAIVVAAFVLRPFVTGNASDLSVGDCFDLPATVTDTVEDVQHHPCTDPHDAEVIFVGDYAPATSTYPSDADFQSFIAATCPAAFNTYTGLDFAGAATYDLNEFWPTSDGWSHGDHEIACVTVRSDNGKLTSSIKKS